jgi:DNA transformation protein
MIDLGHDSSSLMADPSEFCSYVLELLNASDLDPAELGVIRHRSMFGGFGIFFDDLMFALIARDTLYIKADDETRAAFEAVDMGPFTYTAKDREGSLSYYETPPDALESPDELAAWAALGLAAARRAAVKKPKKSTKKPAGRGARKNPEKKK